jgi:hypothetical protein
MIQWRNWKTGAKIGFVYGLIGALFGVTITYFWPYLKYALNCGLPTLCNDYHFYISFIGIVLFLPINLLNEITIRLFIPFMPFGTKTLFCIIAMPVFGTLIGAIVGHFFGWLEKVQKAVN